MVDTVTPEVRSRMMAAVRSRDTKPELAIRKSLHHMGFRFRKHARIGKTRPDLKLSKYGAVIFIHGCFWHGHSFCRLARAPKSNVGFWSQKIAGNMARDERNVRELAMAGWRIAVIWECAVRDLGAVAVAEAIATWLDSLDRNMLEIRSPKLATVPSTLRTEQDSLG